MGNKNKGKYQLIEDFFPNHLREDLPVNAFLLRKESNEKKTGTDARTYAKSKYHGTDKLIVGFFYKSISNIL